MNGHTQLNEYSQRSSNLAQLFGRSLTRAGAGAANSNDITQHKQSSLPAFTIIILVLVLERVNNKKGSTM